MYIQYILFIHTYIYIFVMCLQHTNTYSMHYIYIDHVINFMIYIYIIFGVFKTQGKIIVGKNNEPRDIASLFPWVSQQKEICGLLLISFSKDRFHQDKCPYLYQSHPFCQGRIQLQRLSVQVGFLHTRNLSDTHVHVTSHA